MFVFARISICCRAGSLGVGKGGARCHGKAGRQVCTTRAFLHQTYFTPDHSSTRIFLHQRPISDQNTPAPDQSSCTKPKSSTLLHYISFEIWVVNYKYPKDNTEAEQLTSLNHTWPISHQMATEIFYQSTILNCAPDISTSSSSNITPFKISKQQNHNASILSQHWLWWWNLPVNILYEVHF